MRTITTLALAAGVSALALSGVDLRSAKAADMPVPQAHVPAPAYYPPPAAQAYAYSPPPPPVAYYAPPPPPTPYYAYRVVWPYYRPGPYWRGYAPHFAYGYGHWRYGWRR
ncbi:MAG: hypothetical protein ACRECV_06510 [Xanthobacteraceae bacterium]